MASIPLESLSPFGRLALELDLHFSELNRISGQLLRLELESDGDLDRAVKLLDQFAKHGQEIAGGMQQFSSSLEEARERSEAAAKLVQERAQLIQQRKERQRDIQEKMLRVEQDVKSANADLSSIKKPGQTEYTDEDKQEIKVVLEKLNSRLEGFIAEIEKIKDEAAEEKFKGLERQALSLLDTLRSTRRKLVTAISSK